MFVKSPGMASFTWFWRMVAPQTWPPTEMEWCIWRTSSRERYHIARSPGFREDELNPVLNLEVTR